MVASGVFDEEMGSLSSIQKSKYVTFLEAVEKD
jgi:hypothetical protein